MQNERLLRDFLLTHPDAARRYGDLKRRLAATVDDPLVYTRAKTDLIQELVAQARAAGSRRGAGAAGGGRRGDQRAGRPGMRVPLGASDEDAATAERLQFTVGEGPCLQAHSSARPVYTPAAVFAARWPLLYEELTARTPTGRCWPCRCGTGSPVRGAGSAPAA